MKKFTSVLLTLMLCLSLCLVPATAMAEESDLGFDLGMFEGLLNEDPTPHLEANESYVEVIDIGELLAGLIGDLGVEITYDGELPASGWYAPGTVLTFPAVSVAGEAMPDWATSSVALNEENMAFFEELGEVMTQMEEENVSDEVFARYEELMAQAEALVQVATIENLTLTVPETSTLIIAVPGSDEGDGSYMSTDYWFDANGGVLYAGTEYETDFDGLFFWSDEPPMTQEALDAMTPVWEGYVFKGWALEAYEPFAFGETPADILVDVLALPLVDETAEEGYIEYDLYAVWEAEEEEVVITPDEDEKGDGEADAPKEETTNPDTADTHTVFPWLCLMMLAGMVLVALRMRREE